MDPRMCGPAAEHDRASVHEPVDAREVAVVDPAVRAGLHARHVPGNEHDRTHAGHGVAPGIQRYPPDLPVVDVAEEHVALGAGQAAPVAEGDARDADRGGEPELGQDPWPWAAVVRVPRSGQAAAVLPWTPSVVPAADGDVVELVVARGTVLGLPQLSGDGVEVEAEGVADPVREDLAVPDGV